MKKSTEYKKGFKEGFDAGYRLGSFHMGIVFVNALMKTILEKSKKTKKKESA